MSTLKLPRVSGEDVKRALQRCGFVQTSKHGSHVKMRHRDGYSAIVPMHRELATGTLRSILRQAKLTTQQLIDALE